jgi:stage V sporulation protein B
MGEDGSTKKLLGITVPVTLSACLRSGLLTLQHILIPRGLKQSGASWEAALASYGVLHSMVLPVVLFPSAFISSFSGLLVPEVAESVARGDNERVSRLAGKIVTPALIFSFGVAGIMACFGYELGEAIYGSREAGMYIRILAPLIPIMYVDSSVDAFLKGMGEQVYSMNVNILDAAVSVLLVWLLLPRMGLWGYVVAIYATETLNTTLSLCRMLRMSRMPVRLWGQVFGPILCAVGATALCRLGGALLHLPIEGTVALVIHIAVCAAVYLGLCVITGVWSREQTRDLGRILGVKF